MKVEKIKNHCRKRTQRTHGQGLMPFFPALLYRKVAPSWQRFSLSALSVCCSHSLVTAGRSTIFALHSIRIKHLRQDSSPPLYRKNAVVREMSGRGMEEDAVWIIPRPIIPLTSLRPCPSSGGHLPFALVAAGRAAFFVVQFFLVEAGRASFVAVQFFLFAAVRDPDSGAAPIRGKQGQSRSIRIKNENTPTAD